MSDRSDGVLPLLRAVEAGDLELVRRYVVEGADLEAVGAWEPWQAALGCAAAGGHIEIVRFLLAQGANVNGPAESRRGPLSEAVAAGSVEVVQMLIEHGADVHAVDEHGWHALLFAASRSELHPETEWGTIIRLLLAAGSDVNNVGNSGWTALKLAIGDDPENESALEVMRILLQAGAEVDARASDTDWTPLMDAVEKGNIAAVRLLVEAGADVNLTDDEGDTAWNIARRWGHPEIADLLEHAGALEPADVETDLHRAILWGKTEAVARLLEQGADANALNQYNQSAVRVAFEEWGKVAIVRLLLDHGANINIGDEGVMLLTVAVGNYRPKSDASAIVRLLIERRSEIQNFRQDCTNALYEAAHTTDIESARLMLEMGADVNARGWEGRTALMEAANSGRREMVELLLAHGADVNATTLSPYEEEDYVGAAALRDAVLSQHVEVARVLLEHGADVDAADDAGYTLLMWSAGYAFGDEGTEAWKRSVAMVRLLLEWNADVNRQSDQKETALDIAIRGMFGDFDPEGDLSEIAVLLKQAGGERGESRPRWCYMAVSCDTGLPGE